MRCACALLRTVCVVRIMGDMETETYNPTHRGEPAGVVRSGAAVYEKNRIDCLGHEGGSCPQWGADFYAESGAKHRAAS